MAQLERDNPDFFACDICKVLHHYHEFESDNFGLEALMSQLSGQFECVQKGHEKWFGRASILAIHSCPVYSQKKISHFHLKLAMRQFYCGPKYGISTESLSYTQIRHYPKYSPYPEMVSLFSIDAEICPKVEPPDLYVRMQDILLFDEPYFLTDHLIDWDKPHIRWSTDPLLPFHICRHIHLTDFIAPIQRSISGSGAIKMISKSCQECHVDSVTEIGWRELERKFAVIITRWANLGPGLTQEDPIWKAHVDLDDWDHPRAGRLIPTDDSVQHIINWKGPRFWFEKRSTRSYKRLQAINLSCLQDETYKKSHLFNTIPKEDLWYITHQKLRHLEDGDSPSSSDGESPFSSCELIVIIILASLILFVAIWAVSN
ncbi:hypothetical protein N7528_008929 [Penicillium herquei]|nr:hypothetical protein N7528_008929 [Penicillium herquei]